MLETRLIIDDPYVGFIEIRPGKTSDDPPDVKQIGTIKTGIDGPVVWFITNFDTGTDYDVEIDYSLIKNTTPGGKHAHPFPWRLFNVRKTNVRKAGTSAGTAALVDVIKRHQLDKNPDTYKYSIEVSKGRRRTVLDPDIEVTDPYPLLMPAK